MDMDMEAVAGVESLLRGRRVGCDADVDVEVDVEVGFIFRTRTSSGKLQADVGDESDFVSDTPDADTFKAAAAESTFAGDFGSGASSRFLGSDLNTFPVCRRRDDSPASHSPSSSSSSSTDIAAKSESGSTSMVSTEEEEEEPSPLS